MEYRERPALISRLDTLVSWFGEVMPGVLTCITLGMAAAFLSEHYGGPVMLYALLFGMAFNFLSEEGRCLAGVEFSARSILRFGVALLGVRITVGEVTELGPLPVFLVIGAVTSTILVGWGIARILGLSREQGLLSGGSVAICGASAAMALSAVLPKTADSERQTILTVVGVTTLSTLAMVIYPALVTLFELDNFSAGIFLGGTIHDVAQVVGAGYMVSPETGDVSTLVKLMRVAMLVPAVFLYSVIYRKANAGKGQSKMALLPGFLLFFILFVVINSLGIMPVSVVDGLIDLSRWCLVAAIAALGIKTSFRKLAVVGWLPVVLMVTETVFLCLLVLVVVIFAIPV